MKLVLSSFGSDRAILSRREQEQDHTMQACAGNGDKKSDQLRDYNYVTADRQEHLRMNPSIRTV